MTNFFFRGASSSTQNALFLSAFLLVGTLSTPVSAQSSRTPQTSNEAYADFYGNGLRSYTEGNYVEAIDHLFHAFALRPSAEILRLIIRSYDFMGHCDAAQKQRVFFQEIYPREAVAPPDQCKQTASLTIDCTPIRTPVTVNYVIDSFCGATLNIVPGKVHVESPSHSSSQTLTVNPSENAIAQIKLNAEKWSKIDSSSHSSSLIRVPRLPTRQSEYAVYQSRDGLYQIWVRAELRSEQDLSSSPEFKMQPRVEIVCAEDSEDAERDCMFLRSIQERTPHYTDNPQRHKLSIPIVP